MTDLADLADIAPIQVFEGIRVRRGRAHHPFGVRSCAHATRATEVHVVTPRA